MQTKVRRQNTKQKFMRVEEQRWNMGRDGGSGPGSGPVGLGQSRQNGEAGGDPHKSKWG